MGVYTEAFYHFVWATRKREWFITDAVEGICIGSFTGSAALCVCIFTP